MDNNGWWWLGMMNNWLSSSHAWQWLCKSAWPEQLTTNSSNSVQSINHNTNSCQRHKHCQQTVVSETSSFELNQNNVVITSTLRMPWLKNHGLMRPHISEGQQPRNVGRTLPVAWIPFEGDRCGPLERRNMFHILVYPHDGSMVQILIFLLHNQHIHIYLYKCRNN